MDRLEFAATFDVQGDTLSGVVHVFGTRAYRDGRWHTFEPTAFARDIKAGRPIAFYAHDQSKPLAKPTLEIRDGALHYRMELGHQSYAMDLRENVALGLMDRMSFGVTPEKYTDARGKDGEIVRTHTRASLFDISPVVIPAFDGTRSQLHAGDQEDRRVMAAMARYRANGGT